MNLVTVDSWPLTERADYRPDLESGNILFFPFTPFSLPEDAKSFLRNLSFSGGAVHKNIAYRTAADKITGVEGDTLRDQLREIFRSYSNNVVRFVSELLPNYAQHWRLDYASFRPIEEEGRDLPLNKRNDLIHTDAFPSRPTHGDLILRVFTNISPEKTRVWVTSDPFHAVAKQYAQDAGLSHVASRAVSPAGRLCMQFKRALHSFGLPAAPRSAYDAFMLRFHDYLKRNSEFQTNCAKHRFEFPPGSTWLVFTDVVPHSVQSGQHALEQTFIVARRSLANAAQAPLSILETLCGNPLL